MAKTPLTGIRLKPELKEALQLAAAEDGRSLASMISKICQVWIERQTNPRPRELDDASAGCTSDRGSNIQH